MSKYRPQDLSGLPDCSALSENRKCTRLMVSNCNGHQCPFRRTRKEDFDSIQCAHQRLSSLDNSAQTHIAKKYYYGSMPWNEEKPVGTDKAYRAYKSL